jgi:mono/diheme cytochrome c family protein
MRNVMLKMTAILVLFAGAIFGLNQTQASNSIQTTQEPNADQIYSARCARCHGEDGKAETNMGKRMGARNFVDKAWHDSTKDEDITATIKEGSGAMPAFGSKLSEAEIKAVVGKIRKFKPEK